MPRFFLQQSQINNGKVTITGDDAHHISRSLRMVAGEHITVCDMQKHEYDCVLEHFSDTAVEARIVSVVDADTEPVFFAHLYQALPKGDKLDSVIQKAVETGVSEITPFESERCIVKVKPDSEARKTERRCRIALEAAKQCGRSYVPLVNDTVSFETMLREAAKADISLFCYEGDGTRSIKEILESVDVNSICKSERPLTISLIIGSEGGFSLDEASRAKEIGMMMTGLGKRILRTETASGFALGCIAYRFDL
ncbi:MAG: RsmE family RNA methyltransferase [Clostridia bacterium]|nr:RsmE family RNA methyltransferase [Clostridia bacterium]